MFLEIVIIKVLNRLLIANVLTQMHDYLLPTFQVNRYAIKNVLDQVLLVVARILLRARHRLLGSILHYLSCKLL